MWTAGNGSHQANQLLDFPDANGLILGSIATTRTTWNAFWRAGSLLVAILSLLPRLLGVLLPEELVRDVRSVAVDRALEVLLVEVLGLLISVPSCLVQETKCP